MFFTVSNIFDVLLKNVCEVLHKLTNGYQLSFLRGLFYRIKSPEKAFFFTIISERFLNQDSYSNLSPRSVIIYKRKYIENIFLYNSVKFS